MKETEAYKFGYGTGWQHGLETGTNLATVLREPVEKTQAGSDNAVDVDALQDSIALKDNLIKNLLIRLHYAGENESGRIGDSYYDIYNWVDADDYEYYTEPSESGMNYRIHLYKPV